MTQRAKRRRARRWKNRFRQIKWWQQVGFISRPTNAVPGQSACQGVILRESDYDACVASRDLRGLALAGTMAPGETCIYAGGADGRSELAPTAEGRRQQLEHLFGDNWDSEASVSRILFRNESEFSEFMWPTKSAPDGILHVNFDKPVPDMTGDQSIAVNVPDDATATITVSQKHEHPDDHVYLESTGPALDGKS